MANNKDSFKKQVRCSFCGKTQDHVRRMISGPNSTYICNECVLLCNEIVSDDVESIGVSGEPEIKKPQEIKEIRRFRRAGDQEAPGDQGDSRPVCRRPGRRQEGPVRGRVQPLQAHPLHGQ